MLVKTALFLVKILFSIFSVYWLLYVLLVKPYPHEIYSSYTLGEAGWRFMSLEKNITNDKPLMIIFYPIIKVDKFIRPDYWKVTNNIPAWLEDSLENKW